MPTPIEIKNISKHYKPSALTGGVLTKAVDDVSLSINAGDLFFLLGPSGCGKTTLLRMIAGFIEPTHGQILFGSRDVANLPPDKRNTGMVFQSYALWPHMTVAQNVAFGLNVRKVPKSEREARVDEALRVVKMQDYAKRKPNQLSGGQQQRVALARALVVRPDVLLLDEPLSNLDAKLRLEMRHEIRRICKEGTAGGITTVYVTHDRAEALSMADQVAVMSMGKLAQLGSPRELYERPRSRFVAEFLGETNFIKGEITAHYAGSLTIKTPAGELGAINPHTRDDTSPRGNVTVSIRPEAMQIVRQNGSLPSEQPESRPTTLEGHIAESTYLGDTAQHIVELKGGTHVRVTELHPGLNTTNRRGAPVILQVRPEDVVVLAE